MKIDGRRDINSQQRVAKGLMLQGGDSIDILGMSPNLSLVMVMFGVSRHVYRARLKGFGQVS